MKNIFVSSTFKDMHEERDALRDVAADLNEEAFRLGDGVSLCDLRWGVDTLDLDSDQGAAKVLDVCLDEIDRCRPYMIVLLGDRYGWIPDKRLISNAVQGRCEVLDRRMSVTALEIEYGALLKPEQMARTLFYFREGSPKAPERCKAEDAFHAKRLAALKKRIVDAGGKVCGYRLEWDPDGNVVSGLDSFKSMVHRDLLRLFRSDWKRLQGLSSDQREFLIHREHMKRVGTQFRGRDELFSRCLSKIETGTPAFAVQGESGMGKTMLLSRLAIELGQRGCDVLPIYCGLTSSSDDARDVMRIVIRHCSHREPLPCGKEDNWENWTGMLDAALERRSKFGRRLVIVVDGVDQLKEDEGRNGLLFVPPQLPDNVQMVLSGFQSFNFKGRLPIVKIGNLSATEAPLFLDKVAGEKGAELDRNVRGAIISKPFSRNPLFMALLRYRLGLMDRDDYAQIESGKGGMAGISRHQREIIDRCGTSLACLCTDIIAAVEKRVSGGWVRTAVSCIALSRRGLRETDLEGILTNLGLPWNPLDFSRFRVFLKTFFFERDDGRIDFSHPSLRCGLRPRGNKADALRTAILQWFDALPGQDAVRDEEFCFVCQKAGDADSFLKHIGRFIGDETTMGICAKSFYTGMCADGGAFARRMLVTAKSYEKWMDLCDFVNFHVYDLLDGIAIRRKQVFSILKGLSGRRASLHGQSSDAVAIRRQLGVLNRNMADLLAGNETTEDRSRSLVFYRKARRCFERKSGDWSRASENDYRDILSVLLGMGDVYENLNAGRAVRKALDCYVEAAGFMQHLIKRLGKNAGLDLQFNVLYNLGDWYWRAATPDDLDLGQAYFAHAVSVFEYAERTGNNCAPERDKAACFTKLAQYHHFIGTRNNLQIAADYGEKALEVNRRIHRTSRTPDSMRDCMESCMTLAEIYAKSDEKEKLVRAMALSRDAVFLGRHWLMHEPSQEAENILAQSYGTLANLHHNLDGHEYLRKALRFCRMASRIFQRLLESGYEGDCRANLACSFFNMGVILCDMGGRRNLGKSKLWLERGLKLDEDLRQRSHTWRREDDYAATNVKLGDVCRELGGTKNLTEAAECYRRAARLGDLDACFNLGCMFEKGLGVNSDKKKAFRFLNKAAAGGHKAAIRHLKSQLQGDKP